jgi:hypothetical protein
MQILSLLGMYFDAAVVVKVKTFFTFIQVVSNHTVMLHFDTTKLL